MLQIGSILDRKYKILSEIGHGGMSVVYLAINERAGKTWAVKEVRKEGVIDAQANLAGLVAETNLLKELHHKNLPSIIDVIDTEDSFIIVMDYIEGKDLKKILETEGAQDPEAVRKWGIQICDVLGYLHSQHPPIIYRDMKPANLMLKPADNAEDGIGDISLIDFGTARRYKDTSQIDDTKPLGTIGYAAPEQYGNQGQTDARTDIYTVGATLFHLLTGVSPADPPFYGVTLLRNVDPAYEGSGWEYVINKCCQQKREDRYQTCDELRYDLEHLEDLSRGETVKRKRRWTLFLMSIVLCVLGGIGMFTFSQLKAGATAQTYGQFIKEASEESDLNAAVPFYKKAMRIDPGNEQAYSRLLDAIENDGRFTDEEMVLLKSCLLDKSGGAVTNEDQLRARSPAAYDQLKYRIGLMYFFFSGNTNKNYNDAAKNFDLVKESANLTETQRYIATSLATIGNSIESMNTLKSIAGFSTDSFTAKNFWTSLCDMVSGDVQAKFGNPLVSIGVYNTMATRVQMDCSKFKGDGVTQQEIEQQLTLVENGLGDIDTRDNSILQNLVDNALTAVGEARRQTAITYQKAG